MRKSWDDPRRSWARRDWPQEKISAGRGSIFLSLLHGSGKASQNRGGPALTCIAGNA
jgi:hypothetical protein